MAAWLLVGTGVGAVLGHGGRALIVEPQIAPPGSEINVHATFLWSDQRVAVSLVANDGTSWPLGETMTDGNGSMEIRVRVPQGLPDATYLVVGEASNDEDAHVELVVRSPTVDPMLAGIAIGGLTVAILGAGWWTRRRAGQREDA